MNYYIISLEERYRRQEAQRQWRRRELLALAQQNGNVEVSGLLHALRRFWCRLRAPQPTLRPARISTARSTAC